MNDFMESTFFNGIVTGKDLIAYLIVAVIFVIIFRAFKTSIGKVLCVCILLILVVVYTKGNAPQKISSEKIEQSLSDKATETTVKAIKKAKKESKKYVKFDKDSIQVRITDHKTNKKHWVDVKDIQSVRTNPKNGEMYISVKGNQYQILDSNVQSIIKAISS